MNIKTIYGFLTSVLMVLGLAGCGPKTTQNMVDEYLAFYYPTTGDFFYQIVFDWGEYLITTHARPDEAVHPDSEPYRGYITFRPSADTDEQGRPLMIYLVAPDGNVWMHANDGTIPESSVREEVIKDGSMTTTTTIDSPGEPVIQSYLQTPGAWQRYAQLIPDGDEHRLQHVAAE